jgi:hypothetical protein
MLPIRVHRRPKPLLTSAAALAARRACRGRRFRPRAAAVPAQARTGAVADPGRAPPGAATAAALPPTQAAAPVPVPAPAPPPRCHRLRPRASQR